MFSEIKELAKGYLKADEIKKIEKAYNFAEKAHKGQKRKSGKDFLNHPFEVAKILLSLNLDVETISAGLLHDVLEDTEITEEEIKKEFGKNITFLVKSVTKLTRLSFKSAEDFQAENVRKMFLAMAQDVRVVFIKLADRLHNLRTLKFLEPKQKLLIAQETMDIYAPLAHRLGLGLIKWELEDLSFMYLNPEKFKELKKLVTQKRKDREKYINKLVEHLTKLMKKSKIKGEVFGRPKHFYSIFRKMLTQDLTFQEIYDLLAIRVLVNTNEDCYALLGQIHDKWKPISGKFKDYIAMPKANMYQSLHTTIMGPEGKPVEIQIRSYDMHHFAEYGLAAHWLYKTKDKTKATKGSGKEKEYLNKLTWLRKVTEENLKTAENPQEFIENIKMDLLLGEVFVFSPNGDVYSLSQGATPIDFAYLVHTEVGHHCVGAKVNNKIVPVAHELQTGDIVEILTSKKAKPSSDWLSLVKTSQAKTKIKSWIRKQNKEKHVDQGKLLLEENFKKNFLDPKEMFGKKYLPRVLKKYGFHDESDLFLGIGRGDLSASSIAHFFSDLYKKDHPAESNVTETITEVAPKPRKAKQLGVRVKGVDECLLHLAKCCRPVPGDNIAGIVTIGHGVAVHCKDCPNVQRLKERIVDVYWDKSDQNKYYFDLDIFGYDRVGLLKDVINVLADKEANVIEASARKVNLSEVKIKLTIDVKDLDHIEGIIASIRRIKDIYDVFRRKV